MPRARTRSVVSRRALLPPMAAALAIPFGLISVDASAQNESWREYRRDEPGYRVEFPGDPTIEKETGDTPDSDWIRAVSAYFDMAGLLLSVSHQRFRAQVDPVAAFEAQRKGLAQMGAPVQREAEIAIDGVAGREFFHGADGFGYRVRIVVIGDAVIAATAMGDETTPQNATAARFIESFRLLPAKR